MPAAAILPLRLEDSSLSHQSQRLVHFAIAEAEANLAHLLKHGPCRWENALLPGQDD